jgi:hypothetical protein
VRKVGKGIEGRDAAGEAFVVLAPVQCLGSDWGPIPPTNETMPAKLKSPWRATWEASTPGPNAPFQLRNRCVWVSPE